MGASVEDTAQHSTTRFTGKKGDGHKGARTAAASCCRHMTACIMASLAGDCVGTMLDRDSNKKEALAAFISSIRALATVCCRTVSGR